jgi:CelD/BcsL family acetyltransferase involved in cellulose biosynthesis
MTVRARGAPQARPWTAQVVSVETLLQLAATLSTPTGFQTPLWQRAIYRHLARPACAQPLAVVVRVAATGEVAALFALEVRREAGVRIARFADLGVADYNAPTVLAVGAFDADAAQAVVAALVRAVPGVDVVAFDRVHPGTLDMHPAAQPARHSGNSLTIIDSVDDFIRSRGKKYRKEVERCYRVMESEGAWSFQRAEGADAIDAAFTALEQQQAGRHAGTADYALNAGQFSMFYRDVLGDPAGTAQIFTLTVNGTIIAALLGLQHQQTMTLLRIANGGEAWRHVSPGRLIVVELMRHCCPQGIKTFDMGIGDYAFKRGFGTEPVPLVDIIIPATLRGWPYVAAMRLKSRLRRNDRVRALVQRMRRAG